MAEERISLGQMPDSFGRLIMAAEELLDALDEHGVPDEVQPEVEKLDAALVECAQAVVDGVVPVEVFRDFIVALHETALAFTTVPMPVAIQGEVNRVMESAAMARHDLPGR